MLLLQPQHRIDRHAAEAMRKHVLAKAVADRAKEWTTTHTQALPKALLVEIAVGKVDLSDAMVTDNMAKAGVINPYADKSAAPAPEPKATGTFGETAEERKMRAIKEILGGGDITRDEFDALAKKVKDLDQGQGLRLTVTNNNTGTTKRIDGAHEVLASLVDAVNDGFDNLWLVGEAGCGKTRVSKSLADSLGLDFASEGCSDETSKGTLLGRLNPDNTYTETEFLRLYENGGVFLLDEADAAPSEVLIVLNAALDNGWIVLGNHPDPSRRERKRHPNFVVVVAANTFGLGPTARYVGRSKIDEATRDRFRGAVFTMDYDKRIEKALMPDTKRGGEALTWVWDLRAKTRDNAIDRVVSTRFVRAVGQMVANDRDPELIRKRMLCDWTRPELAKVGCEKYASDYA